MVTDVLFTLLIATGHGGAGQQQGKEAFLLFPLALRPAGSLQQRALQEGSMAIGRGEVPTAAAAACSPAGTTPPAVATRAADDDAPPAAAAATGGRVAPLFRKSMVVLWARVQHSATKKLQLLATRSTYYVRPWTALTEPGKHDK